MIIDTQTFDALSKSCDQALLTINRFFSAFENTGKRIPARVHVTNRQYELLVAQWKRQNQDHNDQTRLQQEPITLLHQGVELVAEKPEQLKFRQNNS